jgi:hypothetical protein
MLRHRLALQMNRTLAELDETLSVEEEYEWYVFDQIDPIGMRRFDTLAARICSCLTGETMPPPDWGSHLEQFLPADYADVERMLTGALSASYAANKNKA